MDESKLSPSYTNSMHLMVGNRSSFYQSDYDTAVEDTSSVNGSVYFSMDEDSENETTIVVENKENVPHENKSPVTNPVVNSNKKPRNSLLKKTLLKRTLNLVENIGKPTNQRKVSFDLPPVTQNEGTQEETHADVGSSQAIDSNGALGSEGRNDNVDNNNKANNNNQETVDTNGSSDTKGTKKNNDSSSIDNDSVTNSINDIISNHKDDNNSTNNISDTTHGASVSTAITTVGTAIEITTVIQTNNDINGKTKTTNKNNSIRKMKINSPIVLKRTTNSVKIARESFRRVNNKPKLLSYSGKAINNTDNKPAVSPPVNGFEANKAIIDVKKLVSSIKENSNGGPSKCKVPNNTEIKKETTPEALKKLPAAKPVPKNTPIELKPTVAEIANKKKEINFILLNKRKSIMASRKSIVSRPSILATKSTSVTALRRQTKNFIRNSFGNEGPKNLPKVVSIAPVPKIVITDVANPSRPNSTTDDVRDYVQSSTTATDFAVPTVPAIPIAPAKADFVRPSARTANTIASTRNKHTSAQSKSDSEVEIGGNGRGNHQCEECKRTFQTEVALKIHKNKHPSINAKKTAMVGKFLTPISVSTTSITASPKCKYCDKKFDIALALNKHLESHCTKIPAADRRRLLSKNVNQNKGQQVSSTSSSETKHKNRSSIFEINNSNIVGELLGHSGIYRTPAKSIRCNICGITFINCYDYAEHCTSLH